MNYTILNPKGIDFTIQKLQNYLFEKLNWGDIDIYGRVYKNQSEQKSLIVEAYIGNNEYKDVFTDDAKNASIFFIEDDSHQSKDGVKFTCKIKIVFMVNLNNIYPNITHRADMEVEIEAVKLIRNKTGFVFEKLEKGINQCLGNFNTDHIKLTDTQPYHVFAITGEIAYQISCLTN